MSRVVGALLLLLYGLANLREVCAQPLLDRVLERVEQELDERTQPVPIEDRPAGAPARPNPPGPEPGYLGIVADDRKELGRGVRILEVVAGGPADIGGLATDDLITTIDLKPVRSMEEMAKILAAMPAGTDVEFGVRRGAETLSITVTLSPRPAPAERRFEQFGRQPDDLEAAGAPRVERPRLGVRTLPITAQSQAQLRLASREGAIVVAVTPGSPAQRGGIRVGAVIRRINDQVVTSPDQLAGLVAAAAEPELLISVIQNGRESTLQVPLLDEPAPATRPVPPAVDAPAPAPAPAEPLGEPLSEPLAEPLPPQRGPAGDPLSEEAPWEAIERRLQELEDRIEKLEAALDERT